MDSLALTQRNRSLAERYARALAGSVEGVLLSGSNAWGAGYAVTPESDVDLLCTGSVSELEKAVEILIAERLLDSKEKARYKSFAQLQQKGEADFFSTIADIGTVNVSIDLMPLEVVKEICDFEHLRHRVSDEVEIRFVREFRINPPKDGGYSVDALYGPSPCNYHPLYKIAGEGNYLADTLVDGMAGPRYCMGVMSFFFAVSPVILADRKGLLKEYTDWLSSRIKGLINEESLIHLTREERMSPEALKRAKDSLT